MTANDGFQVDVHAGPNGTIVVAVRGEVDLKTSPELRDVLLSQARGAQRLIVDLAGVAYMDSSGVGTLVYVKREVERGHGQLILAGVQARVRSVLEITQLHKFFKIVASASEVQG